MVGLVMTGAIKKQVSVCERKITLTTVARLTLGMTDRRKRIVVASKHGTTKSVVVLPSIRLRFANPI
jgi:hypothetical protein